MGGATTAYTFDLRGRRTRQSSPSQAATYTWDPQSDRLTAYALDRAPLGSPDVTAVFSYDASGQRTRSVVTSGGVTTTTDYTYEGLQLTRLASVTGSVTTTLTYLYDELSRPLALMASSSDTSAVYALSFQVDARGDVVGIVDMAGAPVAWWSYDAWGNPTGSATAGTTGAAGVPAATAQRIAAAVASLDPASARAYPRWAQNAPRPGLRRGAVVLSEESSAHARMKEFTNVPARRPLGPARARARFREGREGRPGGR